MSKALIIYEQGSVAQSLARALFTLVLVLCLGCDERAEVDWCQFASPKETASLRVTYLEAWAYSPHQIRFYVGDVLIGQRELKNDGANLGPHNIEVAWLEESRVEVTLRGQEQVPDSFVLAWKP